MDGGEMVYPPSQEIVEKNVDGISDFLENFEADIYILQEVDYSSDRTERMDQISIYSGIKNFGYSYARNYMCEFVPFPIPPLGKMDSGIMTMSEYTLSAGRFMQPSCRPQSSMLYMTVKKFFAAPSSGQLLPSLWKEPGPMPPFAAIAMLNSELLFSTLSITPSYTHIILLLKSAAPATARPNCRLCFSSEYSIAPETISSLEGK